MFTRCQTQQREYAALFDLRWAVAYVGKYPVRPGRPPVAPVLDYLVERRHLQHICGHYALGIGYPLKVLESPHARGRQRPEIYRLPVRSTRTSANSR